MKQKLRRHSLPALLVVALASTLSVQAEDLKVKAEEALANFKLADATLTNLFDKAAGYASHSFNVSSFAGQTVTLTFSGTEDASLQTSFVVDDTALTTS